MKTYTLTAMDCVSGYTKRIRVEANTREEAIYKVESDPRHEYEIIEFDDWSSSVALRGYITRAIALKLESILS